MKSILKNILLGILTLVTSGSLVTAQTIDFDSGSDGSDGALNVTEDTVLDLPSDGIFHFTTIDVAEGATLSFNRNALNTPVYLLATGAINVDGVINVSGENGQVNRGGQSGPGGFDGGNPRFVGIPPGAGQGPGGGLGGENSSSGAGGGAYGSRASSPNGSDGNIYGTPLLVPLLGGSGGGGNDRGGGGGGGAVLLASNTNISVNGTILARGGSGFDGFTFRNNAGSGGAIRLVAPQIVGSGDIDVDSGLGGDGRIRIDTLDATQLFDLTFTPASALSAGSFMVVFPDPTPRLDIVEASGTAIAEGTTEPVLVILPFNSDPDRTITVQARDFQGVVPIRVSLVPQNGEPVNYDSEIDMGTGNPATIDVAVTFPLNVATEVLVWTR